MGVEFERNVKDVGYSEEGVYKKVWEVNKVEGVGEGVEMVKEKVEGKVEDMWLEGDWIRLKVEGMSVRLGMIEGEGLKWMKFEGEKWGIGLNGGYLCLGCSK